MATISNLADASAALSAGYVKTQVDRGAAFSPRYLTRFEKMLGSGTEAPYIRIVEGESNSSANAADTAAVAVLNAVRKHHYGGAPGRADGELTSAHSRGGTPTVDD